MTMVHMGIELKPWDESTPALHYSLLIIIIITLYIMKTQIKSRCYRNETRDPQSCPNITEADLEGGGAC